MYANNQQKLGGTPAGTTGVSRRVLVALLVGAVTTACCAFGLAGSAGASSALSGWSISYQAHVEDYGWQPWVYDNAVAGTTGQSKRLEALKVMLNSARFPRANVCYQAHVQDVGWQSPVCNGLMAGTVGQGKRMEAISIRLDNAPGYHVCYTVHVQDFGWLPEQCDGAIAGTTGQSRRMEAIRIRITR